MSKQENSLCLLPSYVEMLHKIAESNLINSRACFIKRQIFNFLFLPLVIENQTKRSVGLFHNRDLKHIKFLTFFISLMIIYYILIECLRMFFLNIFRANFVLKIWLDLTYCNAAINVKPEGGGGGGPRAESWESWEAINNINIVSCCSNIL